MVSNKAFLTTKDAADLLGVSVSTIRRWTDEGTISCVRIGKSQYRKYYYDEIISLRDKFYGKQLTIDSLLPTPSIDKSIAADPHPAHYLMHKYWGRKPHNVVSYYISNYTQPGDTVLEPFMGSGVTVIESIKLGRRAIGIDINPMSKFIVENTISKVNLKEFEKEYRNISHDIEIMYSFMYETTCPVCGAKATVESAVWEEDSLKRIKGICSLHKTFIKDADETDIELYSKCSEYKKKCVDEGSIAYPQDEIMKYVKRSGREHIDELFSDRALVILSSIRKKIIEVDDREIQSLLLFCFTSMLPNVSRMLPGDLEKATYKSGWVISKFWTPKVHTERNIFMCMDLRFRAILKGKKELESIHPELAELRIGDSSNLADIKSESIDYIFTDPPYGESIAYLALSQFWNCWLDTSVDYSDEIIIDPYRNKGYDDYANRTKKAYSELFRVLKTGHYMSFTFHNRDLNVWKAILDACNEAGFELESIVLQEQAVSSGTQGINRKNTLTGDFVYNFKKANDKACPRDSVIDAKKFVSEMLNDYIVNRNGATPSEIYEYIIPLIVRHNAYTDSDGTAVNIDNILKKEFEYVKTNDTKLGGAYKWVPKK